MKKRPPTVNFATQEFRRQHGFQPRGRACWIFYFSDEPHVRWRASAKPLTYTDAKHLAVLEARRRNVTAVRLDPNPEELKLYENENPR